MTELTEFALEYLAGLLLALLLGLYLGRRAGIQARWDAARVLRWIWGFSSRVLTEGTPEDYDGGFRGCVHEVHDVIKDFLGRGATPEYDIPPVLLPTARKPEKVPLRTLVQRQWRGGGIR